MMCFNTLSSAGCQLPRQHQRITEPRFEPGMVGCEATSVLFRPLHEEYYEKISIRDRQDAGFDTTVVSFLMTFCKRPAAAAVAIDLSC